MEATIIMAKCKNSKESFGIRAEKWESEWLFTWAFKLSDKVAANEGYSSTTVAGVIRLDDDYPGCPHCYSMGFTQCGSCKKIACYSGNEERVTCPHCRNSLKVISTDSFDGMKGGAF